jgi:hypothetical protein
LGFRFTFGTFHKHANSMSPLRLLRACRERPDGKRAAKRDNELSPWDENCHVTLPRVGVSMKWDDITHLAKGRPMLCDAQ